MPISIYSFAWTFAIGLPLLALVGWLTRRREVRPRASRMVIAVVAALTITPTVWAPFDKTYIEAAVFVLLPGIAGLTSPVFSFLIGGLPVIFVTALIYGLWHLLLRRVA